MSERSSVPSPVDGLATITPQRSPFRMQSSSAPLSLRSNIRNFGVTATVLVGSSASRSQPPSSYLIHKDLLTSSSPFFAGALNGTFAEGFDQTVKLPEEKPETFDWFVWWLYSGSLTTPAPATASCAASDGAPAPPPVGSALMLSPTTGLPINKLSTLSEHTDGELRNAAGSPKYFLLLDLYALADRLCVQALGNEIIDTMARLSEATNSVPTPSDTFILYEQIRESAAVRALVLDLFAYKKTDKLLESHRDEWHPRFLRELVVKLKRGGGAESLDRHAL
ncbi:PAB1 binding protein, partial [Elasticomyces elasticus]